MTSTGSNILSFSTTNGLSNLELTELITDDLRANNFNSSRVAADFVQILRIETDDILVDTEIELANNAHIILKKGTEDEVILNDNVLINLDGMRSNIQQQLDIQSENISDNSGNIVVNVNNIASNLVKINNNTGNINSNELNILA